MRNDEIWRLRLASSEAYGDDPFDTPATQKSLLFSKDGNVILDFVPETDLEYYYPSAVGFGLFFQGSFESGEIGFAAKVLEQATAPCIFDVGANIGVHAISWARAIPGSIIHAFEPVPRNIHLLGKNVRRLNLSERIFVNEAAVGSADGEAILHECRDAAYSSIRASDRNPTVDVYSVTVRSLDSYVSEHEIQRVDLIKIDVEGFEDEVLAGAADTLKRFSPHLFIEIESDNHNPDPERTIQSLRDLGYRAYVINDGIVTDFTSHDDRFYNYFFVHESRNVRIPGTDLLAARRSSAFHIDLIRRQEKSLKDLQLSMLEKDQKIGHLKAVAEERLALVRQLEATCNELQILQNETFSAGLLSEQLQSVTAEMNVQRRAAAERAELVEKLTSELRLRESDITAHTQTLASMTADVETKALAVAGLEETLRLQRKESRSQLQSLTVEMNVQRRAAAERAELIEKLSLELNERESEIETLRATVSSLTEESRAKERANANLTKDAEKTQKAAVQLDSVTAEMRVQQRAAAERALLIESLTVELRAREEKIAALENAEHAVADIPNVGEEALQQLQSVTDEMKIQQSVAAERGNLIERLTAELRLREKELEQLRASVSSISAENTSLLKVAQERQEIIDQLDVLARERLEIIRTLDRRDDG